jgi:hypothetical protein
MSRIRNTVLNTTALFILVLVVDAYKRNFEIPIYKLSVCRFCHKSLHDDWEDSADTEAGGNIPGSYKNNDLLKTIQN